MRVTRIDQIAIAVADLDEALAFYDRAFGLVASSREQIADDSVEEAIIDLGGVAIQLVAPTDDESPVARFLERRGPGLHHIGFSVASLDDALDHLRDADVELVDDEPRRGGSGTRIAFVHPRSTGGVLVELVDDPDA